MQSNSKQFPRNSADSSVRISQYKFFEVRQAFTHQFMSS